MSHYFFYFLLGKKTRKNCADSNLEVKMENAIPFGYKDELFCAQNTKDEHSTCPGDSGE